MIYKIINSLIFFYKSWFLINLIIFFFINLDFLNRKYTINIINDFSRTEESKDWFSEIVHEFKVHSH